MKQVVLTAKGERSRNEYQGLVRALEERSAARWGATKIHALRQILQAFVTDPDLPLLQGLQPYPDGWRAARPARKALPHFPTVLHRGGFPDGS